MDFSADRKSLVQIFKNVDRVWLVPPNPDKYQKPFDRISLTKNAIDAAKEAGVRFVLLGSVPGAEQMGALFQKEFYQAETHLEQSGLSYAILRMSVFVENILVAKDALRGGQYPQPLGANGSFCPVSVSDIGQMAACILANPARHHGSIYTITGPEPLTGDQMARAVSRVAGWQIKYVDAPKDACYRMFGKAGMPDWQIGGLLELYDLFRQNLASVPSHDFETVTGTKATPYIHRITQLWQSGALCH